MMRIDTRVPVSKGGLVRPITACKCLEVAATTRTNSEDRGLQSPSLPVEPMPLIFAQALPGHPPEEVRGTGHILGVYGSVFTPVAPMAQAAARLRRRSSAATALPSRRW